MGSFIQNFIEDNFLIFLPFDTNICENARRNFVYVDQVASIQEQLEKIRKYRFDDFFSNIRFLVVRSIKAKVIWDFSEFYRR